MQSSRPLPAFNKQLDMPGKSEAQFHYSEIAQTLLAPPSRGFWVRYFDGDNAARNEFDEVVKLIEEETR